jgi:hypothetical protein
MAKVGHFMTTTEAIVPALTPFTDPDEVLATIRGITDRIHLGLHRLLPSTRKYFESRELPIDKSLHAMMTRFHLKHELLDQQIAATNEEDQEDGAFSVKGVANCGLVISGPSCILRILKWHDGELPPSGSHERFQFYQDNLFAFETNDPFPDRPVPPLNLVGAWETTPDHDLRSFSIVCAWGEVDNRVQSKWWRTLSLPAQPQIVASPIAEALPPEPTLEEITPKNDNDLGAQGEPDADTQDKIDNAD